MPFPTTLTQPPLVTPYKHGVAEDPVIRSVKEAGYTQARLRFTKVFKAYVIEYDGMTDADQTAVENWEKGVTQAYGSVIDTWVHPKTGATLNVRLAGPIEYTLKEPGILWGFKFVLVEA